jgi:hypothetical protein
MATPSEVKLLLAMATHGQVGRMDWEPVAATLGCNKKAAAERWRAFKTKLPLPADEAATAAQVQLLLAMVGSMPAAGVSWEAVGNELGCNKKAAAERWRAFRMKREKLGLSVRAGPAATSDAGSRGAGEGATEQRRKGMAAVNMSTSRKRKADLSEGEGNVLAGIGSGKKRTRVEAECKDVEVKEEVNARYESDENGALGVISQREDNGEEGDYDGLGGLLEHEDDEFYDAEEVYNDEGADDKI